VARCHFPQAWAERGFDMDFADSGTVGSATLSSDTAFASLTQSGYHKLRDLDVKRVA